MKINGKEIAQKILSELKLKIQKLDVIPHLAIILIGNDPASKAYVKQKILTAEKIGIKASLFQYPSSISMKNLLERLNDLNHLSQVHGIIVQQPLPSRINLEKITSSIDPKKDIDGFHLNSHFQMPIAMAVLKILESIYLQRVTRQEGLPTARTSTKFEGNWREGKSGQDPQKWLKTQKVVVIGKGETGGKPIAQSLKKMGIEPIIIDSKTKNPQALTRNANIIISAVGKPQVIKSAMIKKGVILISIGLHKGTDGKLHGDYEESEIKNKALFYTPTPGGVGPVNVAMLLKNLLTACENFSR